MSTLAFPDQAGASAEAPERVPALRAVSRPLDPAVHAPLSLADALPTGLPAHQVVSWIRRGEGIVGWGCVARIEVRGPDRFARARAWWEQVVAEAAVEDEVCRPGSGPVAFGSFAFADDSAAASVLVIPAVVVGRRGDLWWRTDLSVDGALAGDPVGMSVGGVEAERLRSGGAASGSGSGSVSFADGDVSSTAYASSVRAAVERITAGELGKVVLARDLVARSSGPIDVATVLAALAQGYPMTWAFAVEGLVGATPELLVRRDKGLLTSRVLAGTIRRTGDDDHDLALAASLARSSKDLEEHEYAVTSVANSLASHCSSMNVPESPSVLHLPNVMHLATDVTGVCVDGSSVLDLVAALHPSAAVGGTPTWTALDVIAELETMDRRRYAGPVGWVGATGDGEFGIALRCGHIESCDPWQMRLYAGCGIVAGSDPEAEVAESLAKLVPMRDAISEVCDQSGRSPSH